MNGMTLGIDVSDLATNKADGTTRYTWELAKRLPEMGAEHRWLFFAPAMPAAEALAGEGIDAEVIDLRTVRPLDIPTIIKSVQKTNRAVTVEEAFPACGIGAELSATIMTEAFDYLDAPVTRVTAKDVPMPYAANLEKLTLPNAADVVAAAKAVCYR